MNSLPLELSLMIFELLPIRDAIRLRQVCRSWRRLLDCLRPRSLAVADSNHIRYWWQKLGPSHDLVRCTDENLMLGIPAFPMLERVRKLITLFVSDSMVEMSRFYNRFEAVEELTCQHKCATKIILNLQHLVKLVAEDLLYLDLRTPRLTHLETSLFSYCDLYYPDRLQFLQGDLRDHSDIDFTKLTGLQVLI